MGAVGMELTHITSVLEVLILSPSVLVCMLYWLVDRRARSSAKSRSFSWENSPLDASGSVCCIVVCDPVYGDQEEDRGDYASLSHSGLHGKPLREVISHDDPTLKMFIECFYDWDDLWWYSIGVRYLPEGVSVDTVKSLPEVPEVDEEGSSIPSTVPWWYAEQRSAYLYIINPIVSLVTNKPEFSWSKVKYYT